ncbi:MAG: type II secretion system protein N [Thiomonas sp.]|nr:type II secretion system protein N [Thiomonas sp.]
MLRTSTQYPAMNGVSSRNSRRAAFFLAVALAFATAALAVTWGLRLLAASSPVPADAQLIGALSPDQAAQQAARLFGAEPVGAASAAQAPSRFRLYGVIAGGDAGSALIGIDGNPPRAVVVGDAVSPGVILRVTGYKMVWLERDGALQELKMDPQNAQSGGIGLPSYAPRLPTFTPPPLAPPGIAPANIAPPRMDNER